MLFNLILIIDFFCFPGACRQQYIPYLGRGNGADWRGGRGGRGGNRGGFTPGAGRGQDAQNPNMPQRAPPPNYICFRCGEKGMQQTPSI